MENDERLQLPVLLTKFCEDFPEIWFAKVEAKFKVSKIESDDEKFNYLIAEVDKKVLINVRNAVQSPPETNKYEHFKNSILEYYLNEKKSSARYLETLIQSDLVHFDIDKNKIKYLVYQTILSQIKLGLATSSTTPDLLNIVRLSLECKVANDLFQSLPNSAPTASNAISRTSARNYDIVITVVIIVKFGHLS